MNEELEQTTDNIMVRTIIDNIDISIIGSSLFCDSMEDEEIQKYVSYIRQKLEEDNITLEQLEIKELPYNMVEIKYNADGIKFSRLRRISGYLTNTLDRWNNAKQAEEADRVKHI